MVRRYGDAVRLGPQVFLFNRPEFVEHIFHSAYEDFASPAHTYRESELGRFWGDALPALRDAAWLEQRRIVQRTFTTASISKHAEVFLASAEKMADTWRLGEVRLVFSELMDLTLANAATTLLGDPRPPPRLPSLMRELIALLASFETLTRPSRERTRFRELVEELDDLLLGVIRARTERPPGPDLLSILLEASMGAADVALVEKRIRDELVTSLRASFKNTAAALSWTLSLLSDHPEIHATLAQEAAQVLDRERIAAQAAEKLTYSAQVLREGMRLFPLYPVTARTALRDCHVGPYAIPSGATVVVSAWLLHRHDRWFASPESFRPERWAGDLERELPRFTYFPFGCGPRICNARAYAMTEGVLTLAVLARTFRFVATRPRRIVDTTLNGMLPDDGLPMQLTSP